MSNQEKQADEILVLQSIFDKKFRHLDDNQYEISIEFDLIQPITIEFNNEKSTIEYLPSFSLIIQNHDDYPSIEPPSFILSCFYFSKSHLTKLCEKLDNYLFQNEVCVYDWIDIIKNEINTQLIFHKEEEDKAIPIDPRALNGYTNENLDKIYQYLIHYNSESINKQFENHLQTCLICTDILPGHQCIRLSRCHHFYCRICLNNYVQIKLNNGQFGEKLHCPQIQCQQALFPNEIKQILQNDQLYERYERITLQNTLASMNDIVWCPRCQSAVVSDNPNDNLCICYQCHYTFCRKCKEIFHSQTMCPKDYLIEQIKIEQEKQRQKLEKQKEEARLQLEKIEQDKKSLAEKKLAKEKYRKIIINLSEEKQLLEDIFNAERMELLQTQKCPQCHVTIEKNGGCSHMHCSQCNYDFTWQAIEGSDYSNKILLINTSKEIDSVQEELNKTLNLVKITDEEINQIENEEDKKVSIDNRSLIGSVIVNRVKSCPNKSCKKLNIKINQDNWIVCNGCMKQYCFLCGQVIRGIDHYEKKCRRYTQI